jgi:putative membrane protein
MLLVSKILIALVALEHIYILFLEMFAWDTRGKKVFKGAMAPELFTQTKGLAANLGLYNGFLAAGLIWTFLISVTTWQANIAYFFLSCVVVAGIYGGISVSKKIFFVQAIPAILALVFTYLANS